MEERDLTQCGEYTISLSLARWLERITDEMDFSIIIKLLDGMFNEGLIDRSEDETVQIDEVDAYSLIIQHLLSTGTSIEVIMKELHRIKAKDLLIKFLELILERKKLDELEFARLFLNGTARDLPRKIRDLNLANIVLALNHIKNTEVDTGVVKKQVEKIWE